MASARNSSGRHDLGKLRIPATFLLLGTGACASFVRVPLAVPLSAVGGARPSTPQGLEFFVDFGDGVWGQEQERAEMIGSGIGFAVADRVELSASTHQSTRTVQDEYGDSRRGETTRSGRGKVRFAKFAAERGSISLQAGFLTSSRASGDVQDDHLFAWDLALPVEYSLTPAAGEAPSGRWGLYAGPRLVFQTFEDRLAGVTESGTLAAGLLGVAGRWRHFAISGELNVAHTSRLGAPAGVGAGDWLLLPGMSVTGMVPIG